MEEQTERIVELILSKVGMAGPRMVTIEPPRSSGRQRYRDVTVEGYPPLACTEMIADGVVTWIREIANQAYNHHGLRYQLDFISEIDDRVLARAAFVGPE